MNIRHIPLRDKIFITANTITSDSGIVLLGETGLNIEQTVVKVGPEVTGIDVGDTIFINFDKFTKTKSEMGKVAKNPMTPDGDFDNTVSKYQTVEVPVYELDGERVICLSEYELLPWKLKKEVIDRSTIIIPENPKIVKLN